MGQRINQAFTIVELLVVIVVIGILAAITIVSYSGIANRANIAAIQTELSGASRKLALYYAQNGFYPTNIDNTSGCPTAPVADTTNCIKFGGSTTYTYTYKTPASYKIKASRQGLSYEISENSSPTVFDPNWITIGTQTWAAANLDVGIMVSGLTAQTNNGGSNVVEKYCYLDNPVNCATFGGLYQWDEAMGYSSVEGAQGICPAGSHIPTHNDFKVLEITLGMTPLQAEQYGVWRGANQGDQLRPSGFSELNLKPYSIRITDGSFFSIGTTTYLWLSNSETGTNALMRYFLTTQSGIFRSSSLKTYGFSVRCLKN